MLTIKNYLELKEILKYIDEQRDFEIRNNDGYSNEHVDKLTEMKESLGEILYKLESED